ncbi:PAC2 family protein [Auraticoccus sp. F435]|uniref:PAC2 family protein n=1 Tax=Auraticoccus cholistanensis TaxID=2656650 RepID=A0A6A9UVN1_9ACTN|nr:PAC2 family protein [Auraticoccus cholistanensis]MVA75692.1 PAC2 family protein [Auraticoccus cholistanensis]
MIEPSLLYEMDPEVREQLRGSRPVLIHLLEGYVDAGQTGRGLSRHLRRQAEHQTLVTFDHDVLHDYRSRRPVITFDTNTWKSASALSLEISHATDSLGQDYLLLHGPEPDTQWDRMVAALNGLVEELDVSAVVTAYGAPVAVPHTRPTLITAHSTDPERFTDNPRLIDRVDVPASFSAYWELALGGQDRLAMGFAALVPHYLAQATFHQAVVAVLERINAATGLALPMGDLPDRVAANLTEINTEMNSSAEVLEVVSSLETQYDAMQLRPEEYLPSADELGAEFERFLADQAKDDE